MGLPAELQDEGDVCTVLTPSWAEPLLAPCMYKGAKGGRSGGKSHFYAELLVENIVKDKNYQFVCLREIQKSLKYSAKKLIETKIHLLGYDSLFEITLTEIRRIGGKGIIIFQGMLDHTSASIKSLEGFDGAWFEEAQSASIRSLELLIPTIRKDGSEIWFSWNPDLENSAIEQHFDADSVSDPNFCMVTVNYTDNPWCPAKSIVQAEAQRKKDYERFEHIWLGGFNTKSEAQIFAGYWRVDEFEPGDDWTGPLQGLDFGFSNDPTCGVRAWIHENKLYVEYDDGDTGIELDATSQYLTKRIKGFDRYVTRADNARPESISYLKRHGLPKIVAVTKWPGSVEDGIEFIKTFDEVVIHVRCRAMQEEARLYSFKVDKKSGDILPDIDDSWNHRWDALRYALGGMIKSGKQTAVFLRKHHR